MCQVCVNHGRLIELWKRVNSLPKLFTNNNTTMCSAEIGEVRGYEQPTPVLQENEI